MSGLAYTGGYTPANDYSGNYGQQEAYQATINRLYKAPPSRPSRKGQKSNNLLVYTANGATGILGITLLVVAILGVCRVLPSVRVGHAFLGIAGGTVLTSGLGGCATGVQGSSGSRGAARMVKPIIFGVLGAVGGAVLSTLPFVFGGLAAGGVVSGAAAGWVIIGVNAAALGCFACVGSLLGGCMTIAVCAQVDPKHFAQH